MLFVSIMLKMNLSYLELIFFLLEICKILEILG